MSALLVSLGHLSLGQLATASVGLLVGAEGPSPFPNTLISRGRAGLRQASLPFNPHFLDFRHLRERGGACPEVLLRKP